MKSYKILAWIRRRNKGRMEYERVTGARSMKRWRDYKGGWKGRVRRKWRKERGVGGQYKGNKDRI